MTIWQVSANVRNVGAIGITRSQWTTILVVAKRPGATQREVAEALEMSEASAGRVIDRLCARGLTETSPDPEDGRRLLVSRTRTGQQLADKVAPNALAISRETLAPLDAKEREMLVALLNKLR